MPRIRELDIYNSQLPPGANNAITDVAGVAVGHYTLIQGEGAWTGNGPFRTGVTLILPHTGNIYEDKVAAAVYTINGFGKPIGFEQVRELGNLETPIALTGTLNAPRIADALITLAIAQNSHIGLGFAASGRQGYASVNPVVGETNDGYLSDMQARPLGLAEVQAALDDATTGAVAEGVVGAGTGTSCYGWKGGMGTASRVLPAKGGKFTIGALVQTNFGSPPELTIAGVPVGRHVQPPTVTVNRQSSIVNRQSSITYHDSCHMNRILGLRDEPRRLLQAVGYTIYEMAEADRCCGFGGAFSIRMPEVSNAMTAEKIRQARATTATTLVTADPGCLLQMRGMVRDADNMEVKHLAVALEEAITGEAVIC